MVSEREAEVALGKFALEFHLAAPYNKYVSGAGRVKVKEGGLETFCIIAYLKKKMPKSIRLPSHYGGLEVKTEYLGQVKFDNK